MGIEGGQKLFDSRIKLFSDMGTHVLQFTIHDIDERWGSQIQRQTHIWQSGVRHFADLKNNKNDSLIANQHFMKYSKLSYFKNLS